MTTEQPGSFAEILSRFRLASGMTQEELAERAGLSARGIQDLERGVNQRPRAYTVRQLAEALGLAPDDRTLFEEAARAAGSPRRSPTMTDADVRRSRPVPPLLARGNEVERVRVALDGVAEGNGQVLLFSGEPGIGKTRLLQEIGLEARERGYVVVSAVSEVGDAMREYAVFARLFGALAPALPAGVRPGTQRAWKRIEAEIRAVQNGPAALAESRVAEAAGEMLANAAATAPVLLLLDDLQWADAESLRLFTHLARVARGSRVLLAGAFRDTRLTEECPDLAGVVLALGRDRLAERIGVRRLSLEETTDLAAASMGGGHVSDDFAHFVYRRTKGIPRLIEGLVRSLGGRLELQGEIGAGAMGRVFRAYDRTTDEIVAAKLVLARQEIDLDSLLRFQQEGAVLSRLDHPHIVDIRDTFVEEHASCIIMELLGGQPLGSVLGSGPLSLQRAKKIAVQVADALAYAHSQGIVHRDIKPDNVMVRDGDDVKVTDFGIARILQPDTSLGTMATTGMRIGTPLYMAPEQIEGGKIDGRTDLYSLGAMLYHMVTGRPPFEGAEALAVAVKHLREEPLAPSKVDGGIPPDWDHVILKALAKDPARRFQSAREMADALGALSERAGARVLPPVRGRTIPAVSAAIVLVAVMLVGAWAYVASRSHGTTAGSQLDAYLAGLAAHGKLSGTVLVSRDRSIVLEKSYGLADRGHRVPNRLSTKYPVGGVNFSVALVAGLELEDRGRVHDADRICSYLSSCPKSWRPITVRMVIDGTSGLPAARWGTPGHTTAQTLAGCQRAPLTAAPGTRLNYQNCTVVVLGSIVQKVMNTSWEVAMRRLVLGPAAMRESGRMTDALRPPARAQAYSGAAISPQDVYNDYFQLYSTPRDVYDYDRALFTGRLVSHSSLNRLLSPRVPVVPADRGVQNARLAHVWKIGTISGHLAAYTNQNTFSYTTANVYLPREKVAIVVISNDDRNDVTAIAEHLVGMVAGKLVVARVPVARAVAATIKVANGFDVAVGGGSLWVGGDQTGLVTRIDPSSDRVLARIRINEPSRAPTVVDAGIVKVAGERGQVWATDRVNKAVLRIDPASDRVLARVPIGMEPGEIAISGNNLWIDSSWEDEPGVNTVVRVDLRKNAVLAVITNSTTDLGEPAALAATSNALWFVDRSSGTVKRLDARTNKVVAAVHAGSQPSVLAVGADAIWTASRYSNLVTRVDPGSNRVAATIPLNGYPSTARLEGDAQGFVAVGGREVWAVAGSANRVLVRVDPGINEVTASAIFSESIGMTAGEQSVWTFRGQHETWRVDKINPVPFRRVVYSTR